MCDECFSRINLICPFCRQDIVPPFVWTDYVHLALGALGWVSLMYVTWLLGNLLRFYEWITLFVSIDIVISYRRSRGRWRNTVFHVGPSMEFQPDAFSELD